MEPSGKTPKELLDTLMLLGELAEEYKCKEEDIFYTVMDDLEDSFLDVFGIKDVWKWLEEDDEEN